MQIDTPLLPAPLVGQVYLISASPLPWLGIAFDQPGISVRLTGVTSTPKLDPNCNPVATFCQTQISIVFNNLPDVPLSGINFTLDGPSRTGVNATLSGKILRVAGPSDQSCKTSTPARSTLSPFSGTPDVTSSQDITITGCN
jgi:hypothetical protein